MTDTDSSNPPDDAIAMTKHEKKQKKKHKKKHCDGGSATGDSGEDQNAKDIDNAARDKKKSKKDKKRKRSTKDPVVEDDGSSSSDVDKKSKKHKKHKTKRKHRVETSSEQESKQEMDEKIVSSSATEYYHKPLKSAMVTEQSQTPNKSTDDSKANTITLLLFYQYVEPPWDETQFAAALKFVTKAGEKHNLTGRMRVAREGLNCTLTGSPERIRGWCADLRSFDGGRGKVDPSTGETITEFANTEFKLTDDLPAKQRFPKLHAFEVVELVNYGLAGGRAPEIAKFGGSHLEPEEYHKKMSEKDTVIIDVRNHYEANIGRFDPPKDGAQMIDPMMRKSTEFPVWLDKPETKEMLRGKQVLMYCTGGVRCERASALLKQKIETEQDTKELGIKGVYQLQGGIDKYFKKFPEGGLWKGKNYVFDKRFAHAPPAVEAVDRAIKKHDVDPSEPEIKVKGEAKSVAIPVSAAEEILSKCEACLKPWDMYRGKRRCPTCGVPSLICKECFEADKAGTKKLGKDVRCDLCVAEDIRNKRDLRQREEKEMKEYEQKLQQKLDDNYEPPIQRKHAITRKPKPNPERITRLFLKNMCAKQMDEAKLLEFLQPARVTHIQWLTDKTTGKFYGSASIEVKTAEDAGSVLALDGVTVLGRRIYVKYQKTNSKDVWPLPNTKIADY